MSNLHHQPLNDIVMENESANQITKREWVANTAIRHVTNTFKAMKDARLVNHDAYTKALPYFAVYEQYNGHPPLNPHIIANLRRQLHEADVDLRRNIDSDWRQCVVRYPEVLNHYYSLVNINIPKEASPPVGLIAAVPSLLPQGKTPPLERARSTTGTTATKKARRNSKVVSSKGGELSLEALSRMLQESGMNNGMPGGLSRTQSSGYPTGPGGMSGGILSGFSALNGGGVQGSGGLSSVMTGSGMAGLASLANLNGLGRSSSKAGRTTPVPEGLAARPSGKKRHSKDYMSTGRATAPPARSPYAPPGIPQGWTNGHYL
jgi:hypothetical protein